MGLTRKERRAREHRKELQAIRVALDAAARRPQAMEADAADRRIFAKDSREAPYPPPFGAGRKVA
jgi:hypothetical protein